MLTNNFTKHFFFNKMFTYRWACYALPSPCPEPLPTFAYSLKKIYFDVKLTFLSLPFYNKKRGRVDCFPEIHIQTRVYFKSPTIFTKTNYYSKYILHILTNLEIFSNRNISLWIYKVIWKNNLKRVRYHKYLI